jgi:hypothetical protein
MDGPPPCEWSASSIVYTKRPRQSAPTAPMGHTSTTPDRRPPTAVPMTPPVNPHRMVTRAKAGFRVLPDRLVLIPSTSPSTPSSISTSVHVGPHCFDVSIDTVLDPNICTCCACRPQLVRGCGGRVQGSDEQWDLGACLPAPWL